MKTKALLAKISFAIVSVFALGMVGLDVHTMDASVSADVETTYTHINAEGKTDCEGEYILFGTYPQTRVPETETELLASLNTAAGGLPTYTNSLGWTSYGYYQGNGTGNTESNSTAYMWYTDKEQDGEMYRGVFFRNYRPDKTYRTAKTEYSYQDDNEYEALTTYWVRRKSYA